MNSKIINPSQYKKISKDKRKKREKNIKENIRKGKSLINNDINDIFQLKENNKLKKNRLVYGLLAVFFIFIISISSAAILEVEENPIINVFGNADSNINYNVDLKIACNNLDYNKNVLLCELKNLSYNSILSYDENYNITYNLAEIVNKVDSLNYDIKFKDKNINEKIKLQILNIKSNPENIYYNAFSNIKDIIVEDSYNLKIILNNPNDYFVYYLDFPIEQEDDKLYGVYKMSFDTTLNTVTLIKNAKKKKENIPNSISLYNYTDNSNVVEDFKSKKIDMFFTTDEDSMKLLGRYDYTCKKYRDGETYFIFGNKNSKLFNKIEVRKAIAYGLDRSEITKSISMSFAEIIDIPYIYSSINYKYDVYAADNLLVANSWAKKGGIYSKTDETGQNLSLNLKLIVNGEDSIRCAIADKIKEMMENIGIRINVYKLSTEDMILAIQNEDYDLVLAKVYIGKSPDITFIKDYININDNINSALYNISNSDISNLSNNILNLQDAISSEVACIGIAAKNTNVIFQKNILGLEEISYMRIFQNISDVGLKE